jgi:hypothetical protein
VNILDMINSPTTMTSITSFGGRFIRVLKQTINER